MTTRRFRRSRLTRERMSRPPIFGGILLLGIPIESSFVRRKGQRRKARKWREKNATAAFPFVRWAEKVASHDGVDDGGEGDVAPAIRRSRLLRGKEETSVRADTNTRHIVRGYDCGGDDEDAADEDERLSSLEWP